MKLILGHTGRGGPTYPDKLGHVLTFCKASKTGRNVLALCGTSILPADYGEFDRKHNRACKKCLKVMNNRRL